MRAKIESIVIPTLGRMDNQKTYNCMPERLQQMTKFVVQAHEREAMEERYPGKVVALPPQIRTIKDTRQWIWEAMDDQCMLVLDDNIARFNFRFIDAEGKLKNVKFRDAHFDAMLSCIEDKIAEGYNWGGLGLAYNGCRHSEIPWSHNRRIAAAFYFNRPALPLAVKWNRVEFAEDYDACLQLLTQGYPNCYVTQYQVHKLSYTPGGCNTYRTLEGRNESMLRLRDLWPQFVSLQEKELKYSGWSGRKVLTAKIFGKKAFESSSQR